MYILRKTGILICLVLFLFNCTNYTMTSYERVEATNYLEITKLSGEQITGTVIDVKPHQLVILQDDESRRAVSRSSIKSIKQKEPVYDEFGKGISEPEIAAVKTNKNKIIYGFGGGILSFGASFFLGSLFGESGNTVAIATGVGGVLGTYLFINAGASKDRKDAINKIRDIRKSKELNEVSTDNRNTDILVEEESEKENIENLEKRREELLKQLKELEKKKKKKK